jgi:nucleotide-binding universal stress UspA family protein
MKHKLLLAVDGQKPTWKTAAYVGQACAGCADKEPCIVIFHVLPGLPPWLEAGEAADAGTLRERFESVMIEAANKMVGAVEDSLLQVGVRPDCVLREIEENDGNVAGQILAAAQRHHADTIVVGRSERSMVGEFIRGSVAEHLLRKPVGFTVWVIE